ncbi:hypothetical protein HPP92_008431 [Vanilla planifolia]|uniref:Uncharacterized protein n=1 Tax=Vanilla planifolia TaxID=51239 RepID=A0A835RDN9_VANPL|nr:hypothetical protein HPP92_008431 [Vanilla planifolia]
METAKKESFIDVGVRRSILGYPGNSVENHHAIPRTQFGSQTPQAKMIQEMEGMILRTEASV